MSDAPVQNYKLIRQLLPKSLQPFARGLRKRLIRPSQLPQPYRSVFPYTQVHQGRQESLVRFAETIDQENVPGVIVECGVLDGGTAALMAYGSRESGRPVHLFDSWEGLPDITEEDGNSGEWVGQVVGSPKRVVNVMKALDIDQGRLHFHKGWFSETFSAAKIDQIALLHADGDFYESVKITLETWGPKMASGGFIQLDDYEAFIGATRATDEFLQRNPHLKLEYTPSSGTKAYFIRT